MKKTLFIVLFIMLPWFAHGMDGVSKDNVAIEKFSYIKKSIRTKIEKFYKNPPKTTPYGKKIISTLLKFPIVLDWIIEDCCFFMPGGGWYTIEKYKLLKTNMNLNRILSN